MSKKQGLPTANAETQLELLRKKYRGEVVSGPVEKRTYQPAHTMNPNETWEEFKKRTGVSLEEANN